MRWVFGCGLAADKEVTASPALYEREMDKKYQTIYADPPWDFGGAKLNAPTMGKEIADHYSTMDDNKILTLPVANLASDDCLLFLWAVHSKLPLAFDVIGAWGFQYSTIAFEWFKTTETGKPVCFMGKWTCGGAIELCLLARRGSVPRINKNVHRLIESPRTRHSRKPPEARKRIVQLVGNLPRIELFARKENLLFDADCFDGWDAWGNGVESDIEL